MIELDVEKDIKLSIKILPIFSFQNTTYIQEGRGNHKHKKGKREDIKKDPNGTFRDKIYNT